jgi:hypothetical protein
MRKQLYPHIISGIVPRGVVVESLSNESHSGHKCESFLEIGEPEFSYQLIVCFSPHKLLVFTKVSIPSFQMGYLVIPH